MSPAGGKAPQLPEIDETQLVRRQLHVILALDCSGSMRGDRIASLNYALRSAIPELKGAAAENPEIEVLVRVLQFDSAARWHIETPCRVDELEWSDLRAEGETHMGDALAMIAEALAPERMKGRQLPPVIVLVSDGYPSDDIEAGLQKFFERDLARAAVRLGIAIGADADIEILERFMDNPGLRPLKASNAPDLVQHMKWATTAPVKAVSSPTTAPNPLERLSAHPSTLTSADDDIVW